jgi:hypothetical protein
MTEITRKHLEDAARAAGHEVVCTEAEMQGCEDCSTVYTGLILRGVQEPWRPNLDDGDSRRLQIVAGIILQPLVDHPACNAWLSGLHRVGHSVRVQHDGTPADAARAAREAVVLCAAEVGRRMREGGQ